MTEEQRQLCRDLVIHPTASNLSTISKADFLRRFPSAIEHGKLATKWLNEAYLEKNAEDLCCALIVGANFGFSINNVETLSGLVDADWHYSHEDVVSALDELQTPDTVDALYRATQWIPKALNYDDSRALAVKAIWALGRLQITEAGNKLKALAGSENPILRNAALQQLERRRNSLE